MRHTTAACLGLVLVLTTALTLPTIKRPRKRLVAPTTHGATLLVARTPSSAAVVTPPISKPITLPSFRYAPGVATSTNYTWLIQGTTNLRDWFLVVGPSVDCVTCTNIDSDRWVTNKDRFMFYRALGIPKLP